MAPLPARAAFTDFSDYAQNVTFATGEIFQSNGISFRAINLQPLGGDVTIVASAASANFDFLLVGKGVEFLLPADTQEISFAYENGGGRQIIINGALGTLWSCRRGPST